MSMVTLSLLVALTIGNKIIQEAGVTELSEQEKELILKSGYSNEDIETIRIQIKNLLSNK